MPAALCARAQRVVTALTLVCGALTRRGSPHAQLIGKLGAQMDVKKKELAAFQEKFKIRVRQNVRSRR